MKYDIIVDVDDRKMFTVEKCFCACDQIKEFMREFGLKHSKIPEIESLILGLDVWEWLSFHPQYEANKKIIRIYDIELKIPAPDWSVNSKYIEINLK